MDIIKKHIFQIQSLCDEHNVENLYVFGSVAKNNNNSKSDVDVLVEFATVEPLEYFDNYLSFKSALESILAKTVDLVEVQTISNPVLKKSIERDKVKIYGRKDSKVVI